jgi:hypothetical protein
MRFFQIKILEPIPHDNYRHSDDRREEESSDIWFQQSLFKAALQKDVLSLWFTPEREDDLA